MPDLTAYASLVVQIHVLFALAALVLGPLALLRRKRDQWHRWAGRVRGGGHALARVLAGCGAWRGAAGAGLARAFAAPATTRRASLIRFPLAFSRCRDRL